MKSIPVFFQVLLLCVSALNNSDLISVVVIARHGLRTPKIFAPTDPYSNPNFWPGQPGELTNRGIRQHYELGKWIRKRYTDFLPHEYITKDIYVRSSEIDRCLMSGEANLAGLYPAPEHSIWHHQLPWRPVPIHSLPKVDDTILELEDACPKYLKDFHDVLQDKESRKIDRENAQLYAYLSKHLGVPIETFTAIEPYYDTLLVEDIYGFPLPDWTRNVFPEPMKSISEFSFRLGTINPSMTRMATGNFFDLLALNFDAVLKHSTENLLAEKLLMFFGHQTNVCDISNALGTFRPGSFASALIFELRNDSRSSEPYINLLYKTESMMEVLTIKDCGVNCYLNEFYEMIQPYRVNYTKLKEECLK